MASLESDPKLRIAVALTIVALAVTSLLLVWRPGVEMWFRILQGLGFAGMLLMAATIAVGKNKAGRLVLTRSRWKYLTLGGLVLASIIMFVVTAPSLDRPGDIPGLAIFPLVMGGFVAQLYEPENSAQLMPSHVSGQDATTWKKYAFVMAVVGVVTGCIAGIAGVTGNILVFGLVWPIAFVSLLFAAGIWMMLRKRNRQP